VVYVSWRLIDAECRDAMSHMEPASVDAIVTDPPYGLGFMGKEWDSPGGEGDFPMRRTKEANTVNTGASRQGGRQRATEDLVKRQVRDAQAFQVWVQTWAAECHRMLKPGGHLLAFGGTRTFHRLAVGIEDAGFEMRDCLSWLYGSGFPKSRNLSGEWEGWGTALKPAWEPIIMARKSTVGTVAANVTEFSTGALNIDATRIETNGRPHREARKTQENAWEGGGQWKSSGFGEGDTQQGRWPANVVLDEEAASRLDEQTGTLVSGPESDRGHRRNADRDARRNAYGGFQGQEVTGVLYGDSGGASRFFYVAKADSAERNRGLEHYPKVRVGERTDHENDGRHWDIPESHSGPRANHHPTVKPLSLMQWLCRLVTPPGGIVLDPFTGSGTTGIAALREGFDFIGVEREPEYVELARDRIIGDAPLLNVESEVTA
jgi:site-specific DNA-methyltransferase (adenine-specific)